MTVIVGISAHKQGGKSTLARYLIDKFNCRYPTKIAKEYSFADPLKRFCVDGMGLREEQCYGSEDDKNTLTQYKWDTLPTSIRYQYSKNKVQKAYYKPREFGGCEPVVHSAPTPRSGFMTAREVLQIFGTDIMRNMFSDTIWVNGAMNIIRNESPDIAFIPDVRFESEVEAIRQCNNSYIIRLLRTVAEDSHPSEAALDDYDFDGIGDRVIVVDNNNMTIEEKNKVVDPFFERILSSL